jgi:hypothetical protein
VEALIVQDVADPSIEALLAAGSFHPLYALTLTLCGLGSVIAGYILFRNREARAQAAGRSVAEHRFPLLHRIAGFLAPELIRDPIGQIRLRTVLAAIFLWFVGLVLVGGAVMSFWVAQCGTVLDLPPCR